jgi:hypothetical protein
MIFLSTVIKHLRSSARNHCAEVVLSLQLLVVVLARSKVCMSLLLTRCKADTTAATAIAALLHLCTL